MKKPEILSKEECFHDYWANSISPEEVMVDEFFESCIAPENRWIIGKLDNIAGKSILELGCGVGEASIYFAKKGAHVTATDISEVMLQVVNRVAEKHKVQVVTRKCYSHNLDFKEGIFDIVYAANLLHHVDIESTIKEVYRVLKEGGVFVSWDPLAHNPVINIYRHLANEVRTEDERPVRIRDLKIYRRYFNKVEITTTWFFTLWIFIRFYLFEGVDPNQARYWKKIIVEHKRLERTYKRLEKIDKVFFKLFPFMKRYCWNIVVFCTK